MLTRFTLIGIPLVLLHASGLLAPAADWPQWRGPAGNGVSTESDWQASPLTPASITWRADIGHGYGSVAVVGDRVLVSGNKADMDIVTCLAVADGRALWQHTFACKAGRYKGPRSTPTIEGKRVYTLSRDGKVHALGLSDGKLIWSTSLDDLQLKAPHWGLSSSIVIDGNQLIINAGSGGIALNKQTGKPVWSSEAGPGSYATPVLINRAGTTQALIMGGSDRLILVDTRDGREVAAFPWKTKYSINAADPVQLDDKTFLLSSGYGHGATRLTLQGDKFAGAWLHKKLRSHIATPVVLGEVIYGIDGQAGKGNLVAMDFDGNELWRGPRESGSLSAAGDKLLYLGGKGLLQIAPADPTGFNPVASLQVFANPAECWTMPVLSNGRIYCRSINGQLVCLNVAR
jgi:outer membrane protein assembly factor BamB